MPTSLRLTVLAASALAAGIVAAAGAPRADDEPAAGRWHTIPVPVTAERLTNAVDLPLPALAEHLLFDLIRVLHERPLRRDDFARGRARPALELLGGAPEPSGADDHARVPLPLAPETWANVILKRRVTPQALAGAILADRRASLLYVGLSQLDADTLAAVERMPAVLWSLGERQASALAAFGASIVIDGGNVRLPGPSDTAAAWAALAGAPPSDPARFLPALLARDRGRLAYFFDALTRLDEPHRRFALGGAAADPSGLASLYEIFRRVNPEWDASLYPFYRASFDPAAVLAALRVTDEGRLAPSWPRDVWERAFSGHTDGGTPTSIPTGSNGGTVDATWLLGAVLAQGTKVAPTRAAEITFAQRVFDTADAAHDPSLAAAIAGYGRYPALMATLEALGVARPPVYADAARVASALTRRGSPTALAAFQASLALVAASAWARSLDLAEGERLAGSLIALDEQADGYEARVAGWLSAELLPSLSSATGAGEQDGAGTIVLRGLAGIRAPERTAPPPRVEWYGRRYAVDPAAGAFARFVAIRDRQGPPTLDDALALGFAIDALDEGAVRQASTDALAARLDTLVAALPDIDQNRPLRQALDRARARLAASTAARSIGPETRRDLAAARAIVVADAVTALAYVRALGDPNGPARLGGHVARRHVFASSPDLIGDGAETAWRLPREAVTESGWHVEGALLGLDAALARLALSRLDVDVIPTAPRIDEATRWRFMVDAALTRPFDFSDADRDLMADGLAAGRARIRRLAGEPAALDGIAAALGLEARRAQATAWALAELGADPVVRFSLAELLRLGADGPLPFDVATVPSGACPRGVSGCPREASDLALRLAEELAARTLPAALLPGLLGTATQDFLDQVQPFYAGDLEALWTWVVELPTQRFDDYVAALEGRGALRPVIGSGAEGIRWPEPES